jgi:hypothetical protein
VGGHPFEKAHNKEVTKSPKRSKRYLINKKQQEHVTRRRQITTRTHSKEPLKNTKSI